jgi:hypothetical protein
MSSSIEEHIELYSKDRNRLLYPKVSSFEVPFSPTTQTKNYAENPVINGCIYYKFVIEPSQNPNSGVFQSNLSSYSNNTTFYTSPTMSPYYPFLSNFFSGFIIKLQGSTNTRIIKSYDPKTGNLSIDKPWFDQNIVPASSIAHMSLELPTYDYISIPPQDINGNITPNTEGYYNGYYVIFESDYKDYSNEYNSNIFYRKITYYDNVSRRAYFDKPIPFDYKDENGFYPPYIDSQYITLRKSLPIERWKIDTYTYINNVYPSNPLVGPLIGPVITLPEGASTIDNYYKGKYVYFYSNLPYYQLNYQNIRKDVIINPITNYFFYPIYGFYYINAYNGKTRELSISLDINDTSCSDSIKVGLPAYDYSTSIYNASSIQYLCQPGYCNVQNITETSPGTYKASIVPNPGPFGYYFELDVGGMSPYIPGPPGTWKIGGTYTITWRMRRTPEIDVLRLSNLYGVMYKNNLSLNILITDTYYTFTITTILSEKSIGFEFYLLYVNPTVDPYLEWDFFEIKEETIINITEFSNNSYNPLDYTGTMVSMNETVCYDVSLSSLTLPNVPLKTGSKISFYPYVYVELSNTTSPNHASDNIIYSNNPNSNKALFIVPVGLLVNPNTGTFLKLSSRMVQTIKFKPNDNLKFTVYLPDGTLFDPISDDLYPPYEPNDNIQIEAVFSIVRKVSAANHKMII